MLPFSQFLTEARMAPLYHGTHVGNILAILMDGFTTRTRQRDVKLLMQGSKRLPKVQPGRLKSFKGISTTRNVRFAQRWARGSYLVLDQMALAQKYKIRPIQYFQDFELETYIDPEFGPMEIEGNKRLKTGFARKSREQSDYNEFEEFIISEKNIPATKYIKEIVISHHDADMGSVTVDAIRQYIKDKNLNIVLKVEG